MGFKWEIASHFTEGTGQTCGFQSERIQSYMKAALNSGKPLKVL
jgi:hypothetical protein